MKRIRNLGIEQEREQEREREAALPPAMQYAPRHEAAMRRIEARQNQAAEHERLLNKYMEDYKEEIKQEAENWAGGEGQRKLNQENPRRNPDAKAPITDEVLRMIGEKMMNEKSDIEGGKKRKNKKDIQGKRKDILKREKILKIKNNIIKFLIKSIINDRF